MGRRGGRVRVKQGDKKKRGRKSYKDAGKLPRRAGFAKRLQFRVNKKKENSAHARYRGGYKLMWSRAGSYCRQLKRFPKPGTCDPKNVHRGKMPSLPGDFHLTPRQAATILESVCESKKKQFNSGNTSRRGLQQRLNPV